MVITFIKTKPILSSDNQTKRMIGAQTDITENKKIEQRNKLLVEENNQTNIQVNKAENLYRLLADNTMHVILDLNMTFNMYLLL
jgi:hypothetical protein